MRTPALSPSPGCVNRDHAHTIPYSPPLAGGLSYQTAPAQIEPTAPAPMQPNATARNIPAKARDFTRPFSHPNPRHTAQHGATSLAPAQNEPTRSNPQSTIGNRQSPPSIPLIPIPYTI